MIRRQHAGHWSTPTGAVARKLHLSVFCALLLVLSPCAAFAADGDPLAPQRQRELVREGLNAFDRAVEIVRQDPVRAEALYRQAAGAFETLATGGVRNAALEYNLGNTYFRLGELGRAILHYRRAQQLDPTDAALSANLAYARNRVEPYVEPSGTQKLTTRLMFWANRTSIHNRFWIAVLASAAGWLGLMLRLRWRLRGLLAVSGLFVVFGLASATSVGWQLHDQTRHPAAVVVGGEHTLRLGRGDGYDPALSQPLGPGVEVRILNQRADWVEVRLADDATGWLPSRAVETL